MRPELLITQDGSPTLVHPHFQEAYSSRYGAWTQANALYLRLTRTHEHPSPRILEVGFGLGMNFRAALDSCLRRGVPLDYLGYEAFPVEAEVLGWVEAPLTGGAARVWAEVRAAWAAGPRPLVLEGGWGRLEVRFEDVTQAAFPREWASAIYLDPFSPAVNPEPWGLPVLRSLYAAATPGAYLATYSVAGRLRRALAAVGFEVEKVPGVGKKAWTRAWRPL
ncbi:MAG: tRNA (5-methylaminomethyl-2-thiouridine)(34)-methyltransferase MnmD [Meiothermus sp.]|uniref:tRNA (5-methylaminomethyl-2-thiouridine)(34)-methyltransferase MnmD n=1 Tax=Meiothermus sp. TaxID=1955249 RepID=UPI0025E8C0BE|nr:tRNA (5-methylaminomethyl-2-thiouridine)(34)-methyltransferase MnmD [Meiothermus sp.]MCS7057515.1 tRNA (5-methylaminomethyl-2-thiouridine)(34)-methyltransferase MnmD [Meiothermus sp.]MCS7193704.1 tRNA (5-methylaminomethyl-2-thiouridine)(34)-methyltransferase MnmD [Meiothermus sp.]MCX7740548.1 tRNA (5-methylaminomethyl-2-thiouridine)(34)-methyltransferase MnmD [Meiothermus sp.]MDW8089941.1 tRNA (5-methylaminomethyl-2-thiouridine)(34)-methyltransferase MnmD [Meiothermus sp.]MDW8481634.1 tRNA 